MVSGAAGSLSVPSPPAAGAVAGNHRIRRFPREMRTGESYIPRHPAARRARFGPRNPAGVYPVPAAGPETGLPAAHSRCGTEPGTVQSASREGTAADELRTSGRRRTDLLGQLAASRAGAAAQVR